jgi:hypothetical protein
MIDGHQSSEVEGASEGVTSLDCSLDILVSFALITVYYMLVEERLTVKDYSTRHLTAEERGVTGNGCIR